ncbi:unnamed protein product [Leuciscus chuanchicus]
MGRASSELSRTHCKHYARERRLTRDNARVVRKSSRFTTSITVTTNPQTLAAAAAAAAAAEKHIPHRPDEKKPEGEGDQLPISLLKRKKKKVGFFKSLSFRRKKESTKNKSSDQGEMMKDQEMETSRRGTDGK